MTLCSKRTGKSKVFSKASIKEIRNAERVVETKIFCLTFAEEKVKCIDPSNNEETILNTFHKILFNIW